MRRNINLEEVKYEAYKEGWEIGVKEGFVERRNLQIFEINMQAITK